MREYIDSLEANSNPKTETEWRKIIAAEIDDLRSQNPEVKVVDIDEAIAQLESDGYVIDYSDDAKALLQDASMETITAYMDDDIREAVHRDLAPCSDEEFLTEYLAKHYQAYGEMFTV